jgi:hypothetical protein
MPETRAALTIASLGINTRFSTNTDSMADEAAGVVEFMALSPRLNLIAQHCQCLLLQVTDLLETYKIRVLNIAS